VSGGAVPGVPGPFDVGGPLPTGTTVLEASAGTGKTFTIAALVARYVAEGHVALDRMLVVTFGRAATQELRERVRERLVSARDDLADPTSARSSSDELVRLLARVDDAELALRHRRLADALASFDAATVATTHQFCQRVLAGLGTAGDLDPGTRLVESLDDLVVEVTSDLYLRKWSAVGHPELSPADALALARAAVDDGQAVLVPTGADRDSLPDLRVRFAGGARDEVTRRSQALRLLGFDDLLTRLRDALTDPVTGAAACEHLRRRFSVVLVDEFQDTDPVQWEILRTAFHGVATLVLIGDPKQAIYAFRGADVIAYLDAAGVAGRRATLATNWRSEAPLLAGLQALLRGAALGDGRIVVGPVSAAHGAGGVLDPAGSAPVRLRVLTRGSLPESTSGLLLAPPARAAVAADLASDIAGLLGRGVLVRPRVAGAGRAVERAVEPGDIAVLVSSHDQAETVSGALAAVGVPAVRTGASSVFRTEAAAEWLVLLEALEQPHRSGRVRRLALTGLVGWSAGQLAEADADGGAGGGGGGAAVDALGLVLREWGAVFEQRGAAALFEAVSAGQAVAARVLALPDGERLLTDLRHVAQALHVAALEGSLGLAALLSWLRRRVAEPATDGSLERSRRLDSDAAAVQVATIWASKGLEFPFVYVPFAWNRWIVKPSVPLFHDPRGRRVRDVGGDRGPQWADSVAAHRREEAGEDLRLLYVALTRAQARLTVWWAGATTTAGSPLHRLLFTDDASLAAVPESVAVPKRDELALAVLRERAVAAGEALAVEVVAETAAGTRWSRPPAAGLGLAAADFARGLDTEWRRTSYSALIAAGHDETPAVGSEPEVAATDDEPESGGAGASAPAGSDAALLAVPSPMAELPGGRGFGTLVHAVLEELDLDAADLRAEVREQVVLATRRYGAAGVTPDALTDALVPALTTPLGPLAGGQALRDFAARDCLRELDFELPLRGGEGPGGLVRLGALGPLLRRHLPADDALAPYAAALEAPALATQPLRGYLTGSIDAVLRVCADDQPRYLVVDYKTNRLAPPEEPLLLGHYRPEALAGAMLAAHYPLQALLYSVALHRFLRWRQPGYDPDVHLGGVLYLFLRGMGGAGMSADGTSPGVFSWRPPAALVTDLSDLLAGAP